MTITVAVVSMAACQTVSEHRTATGATAGAVLGGGAGALIDKENPYRGALIGAAAGTLVGAGVGHVLQKQKQAFDRIEGLETRQQTVILQQPPQFSDDGAVRQPRESKQVEALMLRIPSEILFDRGSSALSSQGAQKLREMAKVLQDYPDSDVYIRGYTSSEGEDRTNYELSQRRAEVVKGELAAAGVSPTRLYAQGMGSSNPVASNDTESGRIMNRRVELHVIPRT
jgi:chemotaxis protein MotB